MKEDELVEFWEPMSFPVALAESLADMTAHRPYKLVDCSQEQKSGRKRIIIKHYGEHQVYRCIMQWDDKMLQYYKDREAIFLQANWMKMVRDMDEGLLEQGPRP